MLGDWPIHNLPIFSLPQALVHSIFFLTLCLILKDNILQKSVSEIIETRKLTEAKELLMNSEKTIAEIGFELGYNEKSYFSNVFKKKAGVTPSEFRNEMSKLIS